MKKLMMLMAVILMAITASAQGKSEVAGVAFGTQKVQAISQLETAFGKKSATDGDAVAFKTIKYLGQVFTTAKFYFTESGKLNQARLYLAAPNKKVAILKMNALEKTLQKEYGNLSADQDEDGKFVKGGLGPDGQSLFTIYTVRMQGKWYTGLRYGAFDI